MIDWITPVRAETTTYISVGISSANKKAAIDSHVLVLRFSTESQNDLRLIEGDRLMIGFDGLTKQICFKRTTLGGHKLSGKSKGTKILTVSVTVKKPLVPTTKYAKKDVVIESTHVSINAPEFFIKQEKAA